MKLIKMKCETFVSQKVHKKRQELETLVFYGATNLPKLELLNIVYTLKRLLNQEFISDCKNQLDLLNFV